MEVTITLTREHAERLKVFLTSLLNDTSICDCPPCVDNIDLPPEVGAVTPCAHTGDEPLDSDEIHGCIRNALFDVENQLYSATNRTLLKEAP